MLISTLIPDVVAHLPPGPRSDAIAASLREIAALPDADVPWHAFDMALEVLERPKPTDDAPITARRKTVRDIRKALAQSPAYGIAPTRHVSMIDAAPWFRAQIGAWLGSDDPRHAAMAQTAEREVAEVVDAYRANMPAGSPDRGRWA